MEPRKHSRSGSETRKKGHRPGFRVNDAELAELQAAAAREGLTVGAFIRRRVLAEPTTRAKRRPSIEVQAVTRLQGEMNKIGGNLHQLVKRVNFGETPAGAEVQEALQGYRDTIAAILAVLGWQGRPPK